MIFSIMNVCGGVISELYNQLFFALAQLKRLSVATVLIINACSCKSHLLKHFFTQLIHKRACIGVQ